MSGTALEYRIALDFFGQISDNSPMDNKLFTLGVYGVSRVLMPGDGKERWIVNAKKVDNRVAEFSSKGEALDFVIKEWAKDQDWEMIEVTEFRRKGNWILSFNKETGDWDLYHGSTPIKTWSDPIKSFEDANNIVEYTEKRASIRGKFRRIKSAIESNRFNLSEESIEKASKVVYDIERKFDQRTGGLEKIEIVTLNSLYKSFGGVDAYGN